MPILARSGDKVVVMPDVRTVYVLETGVYEQCIVMGVFASLEAAKRRYAPDVTDWEHHVHADCETWYSAAGDTTTITAYPVQS